MVIRLQRIVQKRQRCRHEGFQLVVCVLRSDFSSPSRARGYPHANTSAAPLPRKTATTQACSFPARRLCTAERLTRLPADRGGTLHADAFTVPGPLEEVGSGLLLKAACFGVTKVDYPSTAKGSTHHPRQGQEKARALLGRGPFIRFQIRTSRWSISEDTLRPD